MLDGKTLTAAGLHLCDALGDLVDLLIEKPFLTLPADGDTLKLAVSHDDGVLHSVRTLQMCVTKKGTIFWSLKPVN